MNAGTRSECVVSDLSRDYQCFNIGLLLVALELAHQKASRHSCNQIACYRAGVIEVVEFGWK